MDKIEDVFFTLKNEKKDEKLFIKRNLKFSKKYLRNCTINFLITETTVRFSLLLFFLIKVAKRLNNFCWSLVSKTEKGIKTNSYVGSTFIYLFISTFYFISFQYTINTLFIEFCLSI